MKTEIYLLIISGGLLLISILFFLQYLQNRRFNKYFTIISEETYDLDNLFPIRVTGKILTRMDYLDIPHEEINLKVRTTTILGQIVGTGFSLCYIRLKDRNKAVRLVKQHYLKAVAPYIEETNKNKAEYINLINLSRKQLPKIEKVACSTCKNTIQCQIAFTKCNYKRSDVDNLLYEGITIDMKSTPVLKNNGQ